MIKAKHFAIHELIPPKAYSRFGNRGWMLLDPSLIELVDALRGRYGSATINNYKWKGLEGSRQWSGLRTSDSPWYSQYSQHSFGRAADIIFRDMTAEEVRQDIIANPDEFLKISPSITLELDVDWTHVDVRNGAEGVNTFKP